MARTELTRLQEEYLDWLLLDPDLRIPSTNGAWAEAHGISANTLTNWKKTGLSFPMKTSATKMVSASK